MTMLPQTRVEPLVKVMVPSLFWLVAFPTDTLPDTVSLGLPVVANVSVAVPLAVPIATLVQAAVAVSIVTVSPVVMVTVSPAPGTWAGFHVVAVFQLPPDPVEAMGVALAHGAPASIAANIQRENLASVCETCIIREVGKEEKAETLRR